MKKTLLSFVILIATFTCFNYTVAAETNVNVVLDGATINFDVPAQIINGRTMVPVRKIFEELGMTVEWLAETQTVIASKQGIVVEFPIGSTAVLRNAVEQTIDVPAQLVDGRTLVPVRFVSEFAGAEVVWEGNTKTVFINSTDKIKQLDWNDTYEYWGEVENGYAAGYGALYKIDNGALVQLGKYIDSEIVEGADIFDNGDIFYGNFEDGKPTYGTYRLSNGVYFTGTFKDGEFSNGTVVYANGDSYTGDFVNYQRHGNGTYNYADGSCLKTTWENGQANGYSILYNAIENVQYEGNYVNGQREGEFVIKDFNNNKVYYATYRNGVYIDAEQERLNELYAKLSELYEEYEALDAWLYDEIANLESEFLLYVNEQVNQKYQEFYAASKVGRTGGAGAAANAMAIQIAQQKAEQYRAALMSNKETYIGQQKQILEERYVQEKINLETRIEVLLAAIAELEK